MFKLILIQEIERKALELSVKDFYKELTVEKLCLQFLCTNEILYRGSLPYAEKILIREGFKFEDIKNKIEQMSDYEFYLTAEVIYNYLKQKAEENEIKEGVQNIRLLLSCADSGELDRIIEDTKNSGEVCASRTLLMDALIRTKQKENNIK